MTRAAYVRAFGLRVRELRDARGLSQEDLAARAGLHRTAIGFIEQAKRAATIETVAKLAVGLGVQPSELMPPLEPGRRGDGRRRAR